MFKMYDINMRCVFKVTRGETMKEGGRLHNLYLMFNALSKDGNHFKITNIYNLEASLQTSLFYLPN